MTDEEFKNIALPYSRKLYPMLFRILKNQEETRDALQDLMVKLWTKRNEFKNCQNLQSYIYTMAKNHGIDLLKKKRPFSIGNYEGQQMLNFTDQNQQYDETEKLNHVRLVIQNLPEKMRNVIQMRDIDEFTFDEIKDVTGIEISHIRVILSRARLRVKKEIEKIYEYDETTGIIR